MSQRHNSVGYYSCVTSEGTSAGRIYDEYASKYEWARLEGSRSRPTTSRTPILRPDCYLCYLRVPFHQLASPPGFHVTHIPKGNLVYVLNVCVFFFNICAPLSGTQGARLYTTAQVCAPGGPRDACSGCSNSRNLAATSPGRRAEEDSGVPTFSSFAFGFSPLLYSHATTVHDTRFKLSLLLQARTLARCLLYTSPSPRDRQKSRMPSSA